MGTRTIIPSPLADRQWNVYAPRYAGNVLLVGRLYRTNPYRRPLDGPVWPCATFSEIGLAADYLATAATEGS